MREDETPVMASARIAETLGDLRLSTGELSSLASAIEQRFHNILRLRSGVDPSSIPLPLEPVDWYRNGYRNRDALSRPSMQIGYAAGDYYLQDAGSLLALACAEADSPESLNGKLVCDLCAAPGGKASAVAEVLDSGFLLANEPIRSRIPALLYNLSRTGSDRFAVTAMDPEKLAMKLPGTFDVVLVDAPCSGQALLGRKRQSSSAISAHQIEHSAARQRRILTAARTLLREGGRLIYSTCTFATAENEDQVNWMLESLGMRPMPAERLTPYASPIAPASYRLWPHLHDCAGSFAASLKLDGPAESPRKHRVAKPSKPDAKLEDWFAGVPADIRFFGGDANLYALPSDAPDWVESVAVQGAEVAHRTGKVWKPSHAASLRRRGVLQSRQFMDIDEDAARVYLSGPPIPSTLRGWAVVRLAGRPLGWVKCDGRIGKNHLPTAARWTASKNASS
ncbi:Ribosomal RNA small subunit methyltransferase F [Planctomycetes bacterium CA13]|uniref:Ribosomal RNA small subunit methyltransferase F n=1 Tax=Novipirellula herctigrandis TaxID=2527986 RepID=A0A5C5YN22_9BACT|nr:Ribosomal RNA small subunit methyltransferase F [Planctomycetes bacterium CA13]